jgi:alcohol dehydrogenase
MTKMRAMIVPEIRGRFRMQETDLPEPARHEVRIRVHACGVCHSDSVTVEGLAAGITYPRIPGHEVIGVIDAAGPDVDGWAVGERVGVGWFGGSCGYCRNCRRNNAFACETFTSITGVTRDGGYATHMLALASALAKVPAALNSVQSAPLLCAGVTTFNALRHSGAGAGDLVAVLGVGGLGHLAIQYAARQGFRIVAVNRGHDKEDLARSLGAHEYIDNTTVDAAKALQAMGGARAILATVTSAQAMQAISGGLGADGTMMMIGAVGPISVDPIALLNKSAAVRGWYSGTAPDSEDTLAFSELTGVKSMNEIYPLEQAQAAYDRMMSGAALFRVVLDMGAQ